jgi:hypothetical protein
MYDWSEFASDIPIDFINDQAQVERLRKALGLLDPRLMRWLFENGVRFALCGERDTPSRTLARWYPYAHDEWAKQYFGSTYDEAWGWYDESARTVVATKRTALVTVVHEIGHAVDYLLGDPSAAFYRPGKGVNAYAETDAREFWAEAFEAWFCPWGQRALVARAHPELPRLFDSLGRIVTS